MKIKAGLFIEEKIWREIKKAAIDARKTAGEFIAQIFDDWRWSRDDANPDRKPTDKAGGTENRQRRD